LGYPSSVFNRDSTLKGGTILIAGGRYVPGKLWSGCLNGELKNLENQVQTQSIESIVVAQPSATPHNSEDYEVG